MELPCKLGDEVFYFDTAGQIYTSNITQFIYGATGLLLDSDVMFESSLIGKRFFFTREAAEQALKERNANESRIHFPNSIDSSEHRRGGSLRREPRLSKNNLLGGSGSA